MLPRQIQLYILLLTSCMVLHVCAFSKTARSLWDAVATPSGEDSDVQRVYAIGDIHGDIRSLVRLLRAEKLIQLRGRRLSDVEWTGGRSILVQLGDVVDRGDFDLHVYRLFRYITPQARAAGGDVRLLFGNHEMMNLLGKTTYTSDRAMQHYYSGSIEQHRQIWSAVGSKFGAWIRENLQIYTVVHNRFVFVHAGLSSRIALYSPGALKKRFLEQVDSSLSSQRPFQSSVSVRSPLRSHIFLREEPDEVSELDADNNPFPLSTFSDIPIDYEKDADSPLWMRSQAFDEERNVCPDIQTALSYVTGRSKAEPAFLFVGHTITVSHMIEPRCPLPERRSVLDPESLENTMQRDSSHLQTQDQTKAHFFFQVDVGMWASAERGNDPAMLRIDIERDILWFYEVAVSTQTVSSTVNSRPKVKDSGRRRLLQVVQV